MIVPVCMLAALLGCRGDDAGLSGRAAGRIEEEVRLSFARLVEASRSLDAKNYLALFDTDKFVGLSADGTNWNSIQDLEDLIGAGFDSTDRILSLEFPNIRVSVIDANTAVLVNEFSQEALLKTGEVARASGGGTQVWSKVSGSWKIVSISASTKIVRPAAVGR